HEESGDERRAWAGGGGVTNTCTAFSVCTGTGNSSPSGAPPRTRESNREHHSTHNPSGEARRASCMRENRTYSSYGEGLETDRGRRSAPRQPLTRQSMVYGGEQSGFAGAAGGCGVGEGAAAGVGRATGTGLGGVGAALAAAFGRSVAAISGGAGVAGDWFAADGGELPEAVGDAPEEPAPTTGRAPPLLALPSSATPPTITLIAVSPPTARTTSAVRERRRRPTVVVAREPATGSAVVGRRWTVAPSALGSVLFGTSGGTVSFGAVEICAPYRSTYACRRASCMRPASSQRFSRSNASALSTSRATAGVAFGATSATGGAGLVIASSTTSFAVWPSCTSFPVRRLNIVAPTAQRSLRASTSSHRPRACSGGM